MIIKGSNCYGPKQKKKFRKVEEKDEFRVACPLISNNGIHQCEVTLKQVAKYFRCFRVALAIDDG